MPRGLCPSRHARSWHEAVVPEYLHSRRALQGRGPARLRLQRSLTGRCQFDILPLVWRDVPCFVHELASR
jgi:hypothetical protein